MSVMPPHWKEVDKDPGSPCARWRVGQAVQLREQLKRVARESQGGIWPEYAELDCFACHHSLVAAKDSWRQERGYRGPPSRQSAVESVALRGASPRDSGSRSPAPRSELKAEVDKVYALVTALNVGSHAGRGGSHQHVRTGRPAGAALERA